MTAFATPPPEAQPAPSPPGSRLETCRLLMQLAGDLLSIPFHLLAFLITRRSHFRRFREALDQGASNSQVRESHPETSRP